MYRRRLLKRYEEGSYCYLRFVSGSYRHRVQFAAERRGNVLCNNSINWKDYIALIERPNRNIQHWRKNAERENSKYLEVIYVPVTRYCEMMLIGEKWSTGRKSCPMDTLLVEWYWSAQRKTYSMTTLFLQWYWQMNTEVLSENQTLHQWRFICGTMLTSENRSACRKRRPSAASLMEGYWQGKTEILGGKSVPLILCVPQPPTCTGLRWKTFKIFGPGAGHLQFSTPFM